MIDEKVCSTCEQTYPDSEVVRMSYDFEMRNGFYTGKRICIYECIFCQLEKQDSPHEPEDSNC